jgi:hypothetical protein
MNGSLHGPHAHKRTYINDLLNPVTSSNPIDHDFLPQTLSYWPPLLSPPAMNGSEHNPHAHKQTSINALFNPVASSNSIDDGLPPQNSLYYGHYEQYTHPTMPPHPHRTANGTAYKVGPACWEGADHDRRMVDRMPSRGFAANGALDSSGACHDNYAPLSRTHEDGFFKSSVWSSPSGHLDGVPACASSTITQSSYSDERMCECSLIGKNCI